jgi:hypothetical protein
MSQREVLSNFIGERKYGTTEVAEKYSACLLPETDIFSVTSVVMFESSFP